jgi:Relaxase/Mobilisation nuclease domain/Large polyvalent protein-associated domain 7
MIIRHFPMRLAKKSNFVHLVEYLLNNQGKNERVGAVRVSNCYNQDPTWAAHEITAIQSKNQRAKNDKTYHFIISFAKNEAPSEEILKVIEDKVVNAIGFSEHQRISVVHHDTDNTHIHVAINKIHPQRLTMVEPYRAYKVMGEIATKLEMEYGLQITNHKANKIGSENLADDMEHHAGIESLLGWIKRNCKEKLEACTNWVEFHKVLAEHRLQIKPIANGLVISNDNDLKVKASSVSRDFSKNKLEARLGPFQPKNPDEAPVSKSNTYYNFQPLNKSQKSQALYDQYRLGQTENKEALKESLIKARMQKNRLIAETKSRGRLKRTMVKLTTNSWNKRLLYGLISKALIKEIASIRIQYGKERDSLIAQHKKYTWADWLQKKAERGDEAALQTMRYRQSAQKSAYLLSGNDNNNNTSMPKKPDSITKEGTVIYKEGECTIRDKGKELILSRGISITGLKTALEMACQKFGPCICVSGTELFKKAILEVAVKYQLPLKFEDPTMEKERQNLIITKETNHEQSRQKPRRRIRRSNEAIRTPSGIRGNKRRSIGIPHATRTKPNPFSIRQNPPPQSNNRLRNLSELRVVQLARRGEVLLPSYVHDKLERQGTEPNHHVRRSIFGLKLKNGEKSKARKGRGI